MKMYILLILLPFFLFSDVLDDIRENLITKNLKGDFNQTKSISGFSQKIYGDGQFQMGDNFLEIFFKKPIEQSIKISNEGIFQLQQNTWIKKQSQLDKELFLSLLSFDLKKIKDKFKIQTINCDNIKAKWCVLLEPKQIILMKIIDKITIYGDNFVNGFILQEVSGDVTNMKFSNIKVDDKK